jgi:hypothetical protein
MNRRVISARLLVGEGILLLIVAAIHLLVIPALRDTLVRQLSAPDFQFVWPPFVLAFVVLGSCLWRWCFAQFIVHRACDVENVGHGAWGSLNANHVFAAHHQPELRNQQRSSALAES